MANHKERINKESKKDREEKGKMRIKTESKHTLDGFLKSSMHSKNFNEK